MRRATIDQNSGVCILYLFGCWLFAVCDVSRHVQGVNLRGVGIVWVGFGIGRRGLG